MAISLGFGILFATAITLILVPSIYLVLEDFKSLVIKPDIIKKWEEKRRLDATELKRYNDY